MYGPWCSQSASNCANCGATWCEGAASVLQAAVGVPKRHRFLPRKENVLMQGRLETSTPSASKGEVTEMKENGEQDLSRMQNEL